MRTKQEKIKGNIPMIYIPDSQKRVPGKIHTEQYKQLLKRGAYAITIEDAKKLIDLFDRELDQDFTERYRTFCINQSRSQKDHTILLRVKNDFNIKKPAFLLVEPVSGGLTKSIGYSMYGDYERINIYTALILVNNRQEPKYTYDVIIDYGSSKDCQYTSASYHIEKDIVKQMEWFGILRTSSATGMHNEYISIAIKKKDMNFESLQVRETCRDHKYITPKINGETIETIQKY